MKIYTKSGDQGTTSLIGGVRVRKSHIRIDSYGEIDELNAWIGLLGDLEVNLERRPVLQAIQDRLFTIGAHLAVAPDKTARRIPDLVEEDLLFLENQIDQMEAELAPLKKFVLPGGHTYVSYAHLARTVSRRAERAVVRLAEEEEVEAIVLQYLNRLSDFLFVLSRIMAKELEIFEKYWEPRR